MNFFDLMKLNLFEEKFHRGHSIIGMRERNLIYRREEFSVTVI